MTLISKTFWLKAYEKHDLEPLNTLTVNAFIENISFGDLPLEQVLIIAQENKKGICFNTQTLHLRQSSNGSLLFRLNDKPIKRDNLNAQLDNTVTLAFEPIEISWFTQHQTKMDTLYTYSELTQIWLLDKNTS
jgi:hypothetical protein